MTSTVNKLIEEYRHSGTDCVSWTHQYKKWILTVECEEDAIYARLSYLGIEIPVTMFRADDFETDKAELIAKIRDLDVVQELSHALAALF